MEKIQSEQKITNQHNFLKLYNCNSLFGIHLYDKGGNTHTKIHWCSLQRKSEQLGNREVRPTPPERRGTGKVKPFLDTSSIA